MSDQFNGFQHPKANYSKLPHEFINQLGNITTLGELKVVLYIMRHTWGFQEYGKPKRITIDEFENGRKMRNRQTGEIVRMDSGCGASYATIIKGLKEAESHGFITVVVDDSDLARKKRSYMLNMAQSEFEPVHSDDAMYRCYTSDRETLNTGDIDSIHRSEKETIERNINTSDEPTRSPETPSVANRSEHFNAIASAWSLPHSASGTIVNLCGMLFHDRNVRGAWNDCKLEKPLTVDELARWAKHALNSGENPHGNLPTKPETIQRQIETWRTNGGKPAAFVPVRERSAKEDLDNLNWVN